MATVEKTVRMEVEQEVRALTGGPSLTLLLGGEHQEVPQEEPLGQDWLEETAVSKIFLTSPSSCPNGSVSA